MSAEPVSETAATTGDSAAFRELVLKACYDLGFYGLRCDNPDAMASLASLVANASRLGSVVDNAELRAEILRLRAENERLQQELGETLDARMRKYKADQLDALLRSTTSRAATRERETPPEIPDEVSFELWDSEGCFATGFDTPAAADDVKALYLHRRADSFLVRATTSRSRVSDNG